MPVGKRHIIAWYRKFCFLGCVLRLLMGVPLPFGSFHTMLRCYEKVGTGGWAFRAQPLWNMPHGLRPAQKERITTTAPSSLAALLGLHMALDDLLHLGQGEARGDAYRPMAGNPRQKLLASFGEFGSISNVSHGHHNDQEET